MSYLLNYSHKQTIQSQPIPNTNQVPNSAGGYAWGLTDWQRLQRFLILGSEGGTYYISQSQLTRENAQAVERCIRADGLRVVQAIVEISEAGRAPKNDAALFALALCASVGDRATKDAAFEALHRVARIGTHLFHFVSYVEGFRGWGRGLRSAIQDWYNKKTPDELAFQVAKYQQRDGWSNGDLLRLSHPKPSTSTHNAIYQWILNKDIPMADILPKFLQGVIKAMGAQTEKEILPLIIEYGLPMEVIPTQFRKSAKVWEALLPTLGLTALLRNLGNMGQSGLLVKGNWDIQCSVSERLTDQENLKKARVHPIAILAALMTYSGGHGVRGKGVWEPVPKVVDALNDAFYLSFGNVEATGKRTLLALDVSASMSWGDEIAGIAGLTPRVASAAMAMIAMRTEPQVEIMGFSESFIPLNVSRHQRLDDVIKFIGDLPFGGTDCALPMLWANQQKAQIDAFVIYTDSETWAGGIHPSQALQQYRNQFGIDAKLVVVGMVSNGFTIADPNDAGMLDVVGFDTATPQLMNEFIAGRI